jgi:mannose-1-phosphate guanylyltransferase
MKLILLSGGSGKRLWPLSNDTRSKQFLRVLEDEDNSEKVSMVQRVWKQLKKAGLQDSAIIATSETQKEMIYQQLGESVVIVSEPERRDTFPAIALATSYLFSECQTPMDETIIVLPVDPFVNTEFFSSLSKLDNLIQNSNTDLGLVGVKPTYPSSKYGYIIPNQVEKDFLSVEKFIEKPTEELAEQLILKDALWNCGVFGFKMSYIVNIIKNKGLEFNYQELFEQYNKLPKISFDYEVVETAKNIKSIIYDGFWKDLGTWNTLTEEMVTQQIGKGNISEDCQNTNLVNELDIPVTIIGVDNLIVAASPDGILVSEKASSPRIKDMIKNYDNPPMYEERMWGWSKTLDYTKYDNGREMVTKKICIYKDKNSTYHYHNFRDELWNIVKGEGELVLDNTIRRIKAGDMIHIPAGKKHCLKALSELEFIEIQTGESIVKNDVHRITHNWSEILDLFKVSRSLIIQ